MDHKDIAALKKELAEDLRAIERVEEMLRRKNGGSAAEYVPGTQIPGVRSSAEPLKADQPRASDPDRAAGVNTGLQELVYGIVQGYPGLRANAIKDKVTKGGYSFRTPANAASSVFSALKRLVMAGRVQKRGLGYFAIEQRNLIDTATYKAS